MEITIAPDNGTLANSGAQNTTPSPGGIDLDALLSSQSVPGGESSNNNPNPQTVEIDERFKDLPEEEGRFRTIQSRYDKLMSTYETLENRFSEVEPILEIMDDLMEDDNALMAFLNERKPELIQKRDVGQEIKQYLAKEFGDGYKPTLTREQAEVEDPGGKDWRYYKRLDDLYAELKGGSGYTKAESLKAYRAKKNAEKEQYAKSQQQQIEKAKAALNMTDEEVERVSTWASNLTFADVTKIMRFLTRFPAKTPTPSTIQGQGTPITTARTAFINSLKQR